jgi:hypothetical protein
VVVAAPEVMVDYLALPDHLQLACAVAFVHRTKLVAAASHSVVSNS